MQLPARRGQQLEHLRVGYVNPFMCSGVFVDEAAEALAALELADRSWVDEVETRRWCGRFQFERAVRPVGVVVLDVDAQHTLELSSARDQQPIEAVAADRADPAFGEGVRLRLRLRLMASLESELSV